MSEETAPHWITLVRDKKTPGWEVEPDPPVNLMLGGGGNVIFEDETSLPPPKPCTWCGRVVKARIVERWMARSFREAIWGKGEHYKFDKPYKKPLKMAVYRHVCSRCEVRDGPDKHWIVKVWLKKSPGWEVDAV